MKLIKWFSLENRIPIKKPLFLLLFIRNWVHDFKSQLGKPAGGFWENCKLPFSPDLLLQFIYISLINCSPPCFFSGRQDLIASKTYKAVQPYRAASTCIHVWLCSHLSSSGMWKIDKRSGIISKERLRGFSFAVVNIYIKAPKSLVGL